MRRNLAVVAFIVIAGAGEAAAQASGAGGRAALAGVVRDSVGNPLRFATVIAEEQDQSAVTDEEGRFHLAGLPPGDGFFTVMRIGYRAVTFEATLKADTTIVVALWLRPVTTLEEVEVRADLPSRRFLATGYEHRRRLGMGTFITPERVDSVAHRLTYASQLLRDARGVDVRCGGPGGCAVVPRRGVCLWLFVDGAHYGTAGSDVDDLVPLTLVHAIELYERPSLVPAEFQGKLPQKSGLLTRSGGCGALVVWTKGRR